MTRKRIDWTTEMLAALVNPKSDIHALSKKWDISTATLYTKRREVQAGGLPATKGPSSDAFDVVSLCLIPSQPASAVGIKVRVAEGNGVVLELRSTRMVDRLIQELLRHKRHVWPDSI